MSLDRSAWTRLAADMRATTGIVLSLGIDLASDGWTSIAVSIEGDGAGEICRYYPEDREEFLADLASDVCEFLSRELWGGWPICPSHNHVLNATVVDGTATWACPELGPVARIGDFRS